MNRISKRGDQNSCFIDRKGERHLTKEGYWVTIIRYIYSKNCDIQFEDGLILYKIEYTKIKNGAIKNPHHLSVYGVGYNGVGKYKTSVDRKRTKEYEKWIGMLERCYDEKSLIKHPTYKDVVVCKEWHNFQVFAQWFEENYKENFELDKDILIKGSKVYSSKTCCLVPQEINSLFTKRNKARGKYPIGITINGNEHYRARLSKNGESFDLGTYLTIEEAFQAYKTAKELWIKEVADKWREQITEPCYEAMYAYQVEITD